MMSLALVALLAAPAHADEFASALENIRLMSYQAHTAAKAVPAMDVFSFDPAKTPSYIKEEIEKRASAKIADKWRETKASLRLEIANAQNAIEAAWNHDKLSCQGRLDAAIARHAQAQTDSAADMTEIHAAVVKLRDELYASVAAGKGKTGSLYERAASDFAAIQALKRFQKAEDVAYAAAAAVDGEIERDGKTAIQLADVQIAALVKTKALKPNEYREEAVVKVGVDKFLSAPRLVVCSGNYGAHGLSYRSCATVELFTGATSGDTLSASFKTESWDPLLTKPVSEYALAAVSDCVALAAAEKTFAAR